MSEPQQGAAMAAAPTKHTQQGEPAMGSGSDEAHTALQQGVGVEDVAGKTNEPADKGVISNRTDSFRPEPGREWANSRRTRPQARPALDCHAGRGA